MSHHFNSDSSQSPNIATLLDKPTSKKTPPPKPSKILLISLVLGGVATIAVLCRFDGLIDIKLGLDGGQVVIDGRKPALPSPIADNTADTK